MHEEADHSLRDRPRPSRGSLRARRRPRDLRQHLCQRDRRLGSEDRQAGTFAFVGGGPNACMLGTDGAVYSTQTPNVGAWVAPVHRPPSIQKTLPNGKVEILVTEADGKKFDGPNDLTFGPDGRLYFTDSGDWNPADKPHPGRIIVHREERHRQHPRGTRLRLSERHRRRAGRLDRLGRILHAARRPPHAGRQEDASSTRCPRATSPTG